MGLSQSHVHVKWRVLHSHNHVSCSKLEASTDLALADHWCVELHIFSGGSVTSTLDTTGLAVPGMTVNDRYAYSG